METQLERRIGAGFEREIRRYRKIDRHRADRDVVGGEIPPYLRNTARFGKARQRFQQARVTPSAGCENLDPQHRFAGGTQLAASRPHAQPVMAARQPQIGPAAVQQASDGHVAHGNGTIAVSPADPAFL